MFMTHRTSRLCLPPLIGVAILLAACQGPGLLPAPPPDPVADDPAGEQPHMTPESPDGQPDATPMTLPGAMPTLNTFDARAGEADGLLRFKVAFSGSATAPVTVSYATEDRTTTAGADYQPASGVLTFAPEAAAAQWIDVPITDDNVAEDAEILILRLSDPANAELAVTTATATIVDNDRRAITVEPSALNVAEGGAAHYAVMLGSQPTGPVTVTPTTASAELTLTPAALRFTPADWRTAKTVTVTATEDDDALADAAVQLAHEVRGGGYGGVAGAPVAVTIVEDDVSTLALAPAHASEAAGTMRFAVTLSLAHDADVTVDYATGAATDTAVEGQDYTRTTGTLTFPARSTAAQTISVTVRDDEQDEDDEWFTVTLRNPTHATLAGGAATLAATGRIDDDDSRSRVAVADARLTEGGGALRFNVSLVPASGRTVTVDYATADGTAAAGSDYTTVTGTLTFPTAVTVRTISVPVLDDQDHEHTETFTVTLSVPVNATLSSTGRTATGTIDDNDLPPQMSINDATLTEGSNDEPMHFTVSLDRAAGGAVTVDYATADDTAAAGSDYTMARGTLTIQSGSTAQTIPVTILADSASEHTETFTVTLSNPTGAALADATATGTIVDSANPSALELSTLQVTGGTGAMYPEFSPDTLHYALTCNNSTTLEVSAEAAPSGAVVTLLRANSDDNQASTGSLQDVPVPVNRDHDVAIEVSDGGDATTYVIHCIPPSFPDIKVLKKTADVSDGLMLVTPRYGGTRFTALIDNNGVPRFHRASGFHFRHYRNGPTIDGEQVRYSVGVVYPKIDLLNGDFEVIRTLQKDMTGTRLDAHDFLFTDDGDYLFNLRVAATRDLSMRHDILDTDNNPFGVVDVTDSVLQVMTPDGMEKFRWNSWNHLTIYPDCQLRAFPGQYAHLNAFQIVQSDGDGDGDIVASFRGCAQVLRIDGTTGAVKWKLGGTEPDPDTDPNADSSTEYLEIVGDDEGEFCGQHHVTLTEWGSVVLFDNGVFCLGPRKAETPFTRAVEYDISSGTQAVHVHEFRPLPGHGYSEVAGSVTVLERNRWLVAWGRHTAVTANLADVPSIVEVDPSTGTTYLELHLSKSGTLAFSYRVYRVPESQITIPLNLP